MNRIKEVLKEGEEGKAQLNGVMLFGLTNMTEPVPTVIQKFEYIESLYESILSLNLSRSIPIMLGSIGHPLEILLSQYKPGFV